MGHDRAPGGQPCERHRGGLDPRIRVRAGPKLRGAYNYSLRIRALVRHAKDAEVLPGRILRVAPIERRIDNDLVADLDVFDARPHCRDDPRPIGSEHDRKGDLSAFPDPPVAAVERGRDEIHARLARPRLGVGQLDRDQPFGAAEALKLDG
jgi:hypothetical protein